MHDLVFLFFLHFFFWFIFLVFLLHFLVVLRPSFLLRFNLLWNNVLVILFMWFLQMLFLFFRFLKGFLSIQGFVVIDYVTSQRLQKFLGWSKWRSNFLLVFRLLFFFFSHWCERRRDWRVRLTDFLLLLFLLEEIFPHLF